MKISSNILILIFVFGILPLHHSANTIKKIPSVEQFTIENGLTQTSVNCIIQDRKGFIWIGTQDGLNKFDGYAFTTFRNEPSDSNSLSNNFVNCISEDDNGNIWIGTNEGLNMYDVYSNKFVHYFVDLNNINTIREDEIYYLYQDKQGFLWIKTEKYLSRLNLKSGKFRHYEHYNDVFNFISVNAKFSIFEDHKEQLWVGTKDGLNYFDRKLEIFKRYKHDPENQQSLSNNRVKVIYEDSNQNLWVGTEEGLNVFNWETEQFERFYSNYDNPASLSNNIINDIFEDVDGNLWVATDDGLNLYNRKTKSFQVYNEFLYNNEVVYTTSITSVIQDKTEILWAGTLQGLIKIESNKIKFKSFDKDKNGVPYFSNNYIISLFEKSGLVWVGTWGTGLFIFNPITKKTIKYSTENSNIANDYIHKIFEDKLGNIWIGTQDGISIYDEKAKKFKHVEELQILNTFKNNRIYDIHEDNINNIWIGTKYGLHKIVNDSVQSFYYNEKDTATLSSNEIYDLLEDSNNNLWVATKHGLNKLNLSNNKIKRYLKTQEICSECLSSNEVLCLLDDSINNCMWLGTVWGLNKFDYKTERFKSYTEKDGLPNNLIYSILNDDSGNIWMSTNRGISKFNPKTNEFSNFGVVDGLQDFEFNLGAFFKSKSGELFFGGISGYSSFFPDSIVKNQHIPNIEITSVELLTNKISTNIVVGKDNQIEIPYKNNLLTIEFSALDFTNPAKNNYAYKLEGVEDEWISLGNRRHATFSNLPSGKYTFKVKGSNSDYVWNDVGVSLKIIVLTPFYKTKLAYVLYIVFFTGFLVWFFQYRTRSLRKSNQELKEKELIAKQVAIQKEELTVKNKSITDSIIYAKRIQEALMPSMNIFKKILPGSFILHKAKDIVSGDFYWINEKNDKIFVAIVDCTGHGVPGAFMSIIGFELLRQITDDQGIEGADEILQHLNEGVAKTFGKATENTKLKDGMDIALCVIDKKNAELEFAGAFRPLYFIRDNKIEEIRGDRFSVGLLDEGETNEITKTLIKLKKEDVFYLFSDGYADQFGGADGKKYKYRRFRHILLTIHKLPLEQQLTYLDRSFEDWKGNLEQVDDVLILGLKPGLENKENI